MIAWTVDIDECVSNPCHPNATCANKNGTFTCECDTGYMGDGFTCQGILLSQCAFIYHTVVREGICTCMHTPQ